MSDFDRDPWASGGLPEEPVVRDKRRIDPETGAVRPQAAEGLAGNVPDDLSGLDDSVPAVVPDPMAELLAERTLDLQRVQAEYMNYRRRVDRDREAVREVAMINVLTELLPILDDIGRARAHEEVKGGFKVVADALEAAVGKLGLVPYGEPGEKFDPRLHEALMHEFSDEVTEPTCVAVLQPGYRVGERVVRPARVKVSEPETPPPFTSPPVNPGTSGAVPEGE